MDIVTYALCKKDVRAIETAVADLAPGFTYKGSVATVSDLPSSASDGDMYIVGGSDVYVYDGSSWVLFSITTAQIDALFE